ncbi:hypothetical protein NQ317_017195 [Molorchus minor]|uniref:Uncharacterized protein n=1 Tax=Molorchus minor TaxID=1323400 RepID=A0ABQ9J0V7_9CUCU|nr:hypothetical protein NQ317_017195 [Molorchus minor]
MALWKHRDLVDVDDKKPKIKRKVTSQDRVRRPSRDKSNDSERTISNNNVNNRDNHHTEEHHKEIKSKEIRHSKSFNEKQKQNRSKKTPKIEDDDFDTYKKVKKSSSNFDDQFYDDDGDGLMMKTVNRKNILQQYSDDISGTDSEAESDMTSDDPYDSILVDDQKVKKNDGRFPNVAELGKKLEKLSKTSKYSPTKEINMSNQARNTVQEKNNINMRIERNDSVKKISPDREDEEIITYHHDNRHTNSFKTFGIDNENGEKEKIEEQYYARTHNKRNNETNTQNKRHYYGDSNGRTNTVDKRGRPSYESIDSDTEHTERESRSMTNGRRSKNESDKRERNMKYYDSTNDELSDVVDNRQFLPRTKLTKTNSNNSAHSKYDQEVGLMEYGETLQRRLKNPEYDSKFDEKSPHNGNMYGPWYDLWGLDSTATSPRK